MLSLRRNLTFIALLAVAGCTNTSAPTSAAPSAAASAAASAAVADLMNGAQPLPGVTTSGQPKQADLQRVADAGYVAVIDLRAPNEDRGFDEKSTVEGLGMNYISLPISGAGGITYENASLLDEKLKEIDGPVLLHCASSNRVGALLSLREHMHGASADDALALGDQAGLSSLKETVEARLSER